MSDKLLTEDELKIIRKTMAETEAKKKKQEDLKMQKESVLDTTGVDITVVDTTDEDTTDVDTTKLDSTSLISRIYSILTKEEIDIIHKGARLAIEVKK